MVLMSMPICTAIGRHRLGWLLLMPATIEPLLTPPTRNQYPADGRLGLWAVWQTLCRPLKSQKSRPFLPHPLLTALARPKQAYRRRHAISYLWVKWPIELSKQSSSLCEFRLIDEDGLDVMAGEVGEIVVRGRPFLVGIGTPLK